MPIRLLSSQVANQIAAGEVVERPASVIKELIENSLDAGASDIRVQVAEGGRRLMRVQDNGRGIPAAEVELLFRRHATSKIASADDLSRIATLGFRGEALASIASVAHVTLLTCAAGEAAGTLVRVVAGERLASEPHGTPPGTIVTVEHLFANVPARLKFLKRSDTETHHIQGIVSRYALAYPECRFALVGDGKQVLQTTGNGQQMDVLVRTFGIEMANQLLTIADAGEPADGPGVEVTGFVGPPALHRSNRSYIALYVNRRWFQDASLAHAVVQAYHTLLPTGRYPVAQIFIELDPTEVDMNVHSTKAEVRFGDPRAVFSAVQRAVRRTLLEGSPIPAVALEAAARPSWSGLGDWADRRQALLNAGHQASHQQSSWVISGPLAGDPSHAPSRSGDTGGSAGEETATVRLPLLRVVGQLGATYIVAEGPDGLYLIDQHAAHERVLYEQLMTQRSGFGPRAGAPVEVQPLLSPAVVTLTPPQLAAMAEAEPVLSAYGIEIEPFGGDACLVRSLPALLAGGSPEAALREILDGLMSATDLVESTLEARTVSAICKSAAIKGGQTMDMREMQELVRRLELCRSPRTCPHGRPTMIHLSSHELARQFGR